MYTNIEQIRGQIENIHEKIYEGRRDLIYEVERLLSTIADVFGTIESEVDDLSNEINDLQNKDNE